MGRLNTIMKLFRRSKNKDQQPEALSPAAYGRMEKAQNRHTYQNLEGANGYAHNNNGNGYNQTVGSWHGSPSSYAPWSKLPKEVLERIFAYLSPHSCDESYETCEQSINEDSCPLCELRDLSHAGRACSAWRKAAITMMYHSVRIDVVHYCEREAYLAEKRKRRSRFDRNGVPEDTASARLHLLCRTLRDDPTRLGKLVQFFKTPYMLRESKVADLARTIAVLPNLKYLDLPEGLYSGDAQYTTLRLEVQARCPDIRKMTYVGGSERHLEQLGHGIGWRNLEVLELKKINIDPIILRHVLAGLENLRALKVSESRVVDDDIFRHNDALPAVPPLEELVLTETNRVTAVGLADYVSRPDVQRTLKVLSLHQTGVQPQMLHDVLAFASNLRTLSITEQVESGFPAHSSPIPPLASTSLQTLRYEITSAESSSYSGMTSGYYTYLANSLFAGGLANLAAVYVRDQNFPELLLGLPLPTPGFAGGSPARPGSSGSANMFNPFSSGSLSPASTGKSSLSSPGLAPPLQQHQRFSSNNPFASPRGPPPGGMMLNLNQTLEVFTKGDDDVSWGMFKMDPYQGNGGRGGGRRGSNAANRPLSSYGLADVGTGWSTGGGARRSVMVGGAGGGFLAVPADDAPRPQSSGFTPNRDRERKEDLWPRPKSKGDRDLWR